MELSDNDIIYYNSSNQSHGASIENNGTSYYYAMYSNNSCSGGLGFNDSTYLWLFTNSGKKLKIHSGSDMSIDAASGSTTYFSGNVNFSGATVAGLTSSSTAVFG